MANGSFYVVLKELLCLGSRDLLFLSEKVTGEGISLGQLCSGLVFSQKVPNQEAVRETHHRGLLVTSPVSTPTVCQDFM
jgi:hypothetical protein